MYAVKLQALKVQSRSLRGNVDRNDAYTPEQLDKACRSLRGNVDRNTDPDRYTQDIHVVPYVGTWIEIPSVEAPTNYGLVVPYVGTWIEIRICSAHPMSHWSFPTWERG